MANKDEKKSGNTLVHDTIALTVITLIAGILLGGVYHYKEADRATE